MSQNPGFGP